MFVFKSKIGVWRIIECEDGFRLFFNDDVIAKYVSAVAAADDVFTHVTGVNEWDSLNLDAPTDIYEWDFVSLSK